MKQAVQRIIETSRKEYRMDEQTKVVDIKEVKKLVEQKKYAALVLDEFDRFERRDKRELAEKRSEVERNSRNRV